MMSTKRSDLTGGCREFAEKAIGVGTSPGAVAVLLGCCLLELVKPLRIPARESLASAGAFK